jgi:hypothetical protein
VADVAQVLKLSEQTVRNWITGGYLPALRFADGSACCDQISSGSWNRAERRLRMQRPGHNKVAREGCLTVDMQVTAECPRQDSNLRPTA